METSFISFWHLYRPLKEYFNRYRACERLWNAMDDRKRQLILYGLAKEAPERSPPEHTKNPYFYLTDWEPPKPHWLSPKQTGASLAEGVPLAVCRNPETQHFGTVTKTEADAFALEVHHYM